MAQMMNFVIFDKKRIKREGERWSKEQRGAGGEGEEGEGRGERQV